MQSLGVNPDFVKDRSGFYAGTRGYTDDGKEWMYLVARGAINAGDACELRMHEGIAQSLSAATISSESGNMVGLANQSMSDGQYGWFQVFGPAEIKTTEASVDKGAELWPSSTAGEFTEGGSGRPVDGINVVSQGSGNRARVVLGYSHVGTQAVSGTGRSNVPDQPATPSETTNYNLQVTSGGTGRWEKVGATQIPYSDATPEQSDDTAGAAGTSEQVSRSDHKHPLPDEATPSKSGLMSSADKTKLNGIPGDAAKPPEGVPDAPAPGLADANYVLNVPASGAITWETAPEGDGGGGDSGGGDSGGGHSTDDDLLIQEVHQNTKRTADITAGVPSTGWQNVSSGDTAFAVRKGNWSLTQARNATYSTSNSNISSLTADETATIVVRLTKGFNTHLARVVLGASNGGTYNAPVSGFTYIGDSADDTLSYYWNERVLGSLVQSVQMQTTSAESATRSTFRGNLLEERILDAIDEGRNASDRGKFLRLDESDQDNVVLASLPAWLFGSTTLPDNKIPSGIARDSEISTIVNGAFVKSALEGLSGNARLDASAIQGLPAGSGGGVSQSDFDALESRVSGELVASNQNRDVSDTDFGKILHLWGTNSNVVWTLPNTPNIQQGGRFFVNNGSSNPFTINPHSSDQINNGGAGNGVTLAPGEFAIIWLANPAASGNWFFRKLVDNSSGGGGGGVDVDAIHVRPSLPTPDDTTQIGEVIYVEGNLYEATESGDQGIVFVPGRQRDTIVGIDNDRYGYVSPVVASDDPYSLHQMGELTHNPVVNDHPEVLAISCRRAAPSSGTGTNEASIYVLVSVEAYVAAKGSAIANNDPLTMTISHSSEQDRTTNSLRRVANSDIEFLGHDYTVFRVVEDGATYAAIQSAHADITNFIDSMEEAQQDGNEVTVVLYAANAATTARKLEGMELGWTQRFNDRETDNLQRIQQLERDGQALQGVTHKVQSLDEVTTDLSYGEARAVSWTQATSSTLPNSGVALRNHNWERFQEGVGVTLGYRVVAASSAAIVNLNGESYILFITPDTTDLRLVRANVLDDEGNHAFYIYGNQFANLGNIAAAGAVPRLRVMTVWRGQGTDGHGPIPERYTVILEVPNVTTHVGQTEYRGKFAGTFDSVELDSAFSAATLPAGTDASVILLTAAQYTGLNDATKNNGKLYFETD